MIEYVLFLLGLFVVLWLLFSFFDSIMWPILFLGVVLLFLGVCKLVGWI